MFGKNKIKSSKIDTLVGQGVELIRGHFLLHTTFMDAEKHGCDAQWRHLVPFGTVRLCASSVITLVW